MRRACYICDMHREITQAHHVYPLSSAKYLLGLLRSIKEPPIVWLCPNCHKYYHLYSTGKLLFEPVDLFFEKSDEIYQIAMDYFRSEIEKAVCNE